MCFGFPRKDRDLFPKGNKRWLPTKVQLSNQGCCNFLMMKKVFFNLFSGLREARQLRASVLQLALSAVVFTIGYKLNILFNEPRDQLAEGYAWLAFFLGHYLFYHGRGRTLILGGCVTMLITAAFRLVSAFIMGAIAAPFYLIFHLIRIFFCFIVIVRFSMRERKNTSSS